MVVRCPNIIPKDKQDKMLLDKMYAERDGIVYKAVKALQKVIANGYSFSEPESVSLEREKYMSENNSVISFYEECMCERSR
jgi:putative DNA primase/helicase